MVNIPSETVRPVIGLTATTGADGAPQCGTAYIQSVVAAGGIPIILVPTGNPDDIGELRARLDGIILTGGFDVNPERYGALAHPMTRTMSAEREAWDMTLASQVMAWPEMPLFAICLGLQELNVAVGGTLIQHISDVTAEIEHRAPTEGDRWHGVEVLAGTRLADIVGPGTLRVNTRHHQALEKVGGNLRVTALSPDGVIEGVELPGSRFVVGVQWHPERSTDHPPHAALFRAFVDACVECRRKRSAGRC